jgi:hypothetical protein
MRERKHLAHEPKTVRRYRRRFSVYPIPSICSRRAIGELGISTGFFSVDSCVTHIVRHCGYDHVIYSLADF